MRDHDDRAGKFIDRFGKRGAAVDVQMVGRLVENDHVGTEEGRKPQQQPGFFAARQAPHHGVAGLAGKADRAGPAADLGFRRLRHQPADVIVGRAVEIELVDLMLREVADRELVGAGDMAGERRQLAGEQLDQRRLAVAVGT